MEVFHDLYETFFIEFDSIDLKDKTISLLAGYIPNILPDCKTG